MHFHFHHLLPLLHLLPLKKFLFGFPHHLKLKLFATDAYYKVISYQYSFSTFPSWLHMQGKTIWKHPLQLALFKNSFKLLANQDQISGSRYGGPNTAKRLKTGETQDWDGDQWSVSTVLRLVKTKTDGLDTWTVSLKTACLPGSNIWKKVWRSQHCSESRLRGRLRVSLNRVKTIQDQD